MNKIKKIGRMLLPPILIDGTRSLRKLFAVQEKQDRHVSVGSYHISVPNDHILNHVLPIQPYRNLAVGITAKAAVMNLPDSVVIDIGANVGDTAAIVATYCQNHLILVEPSSKYRVYLDRNAMLYPNKTTILDYFIKGRSTLCGELLHENGSARLVSSKEKPNAQTVISNQKSLSEITEQNVAFVKIDADGFDFDIILASKDWLARARPIIYFEVEISKKKDLTEAVELMTSLHQSGFVNFVIWDDAGFCVAATESLDSIRWLFVYLYEVHKHDYRKSIYSYNVAAFPIEKNEAYQSVARFFKELQEA